MQCLDTGSTYSVLYESQQYDVGFVVLVEVLFVFFVYYLIIPKVFVQL